MGSSPLQPKKKEERPSLSYFFEYSKQLDSHNEAGNERLVPRTGHIVILKKHKVI
jgi:hypothetical protein